MDAAFREHPLWANATQQEIVHALKGIDKYIMTKLYDRTLTASAEDAAADGEVSEMIGLLQRFVRSEHLDIPKVLHNEASWLASTPSSYSCERLKLLSGIIKVAEAEEHGLAE